MLCNVNAVILISFIAWIHFTIAQSPTTPHFEEVFKGKCFDKNPVGVDCIGLFNNFSYAATMDNSEVNDTYYDPFFSMANFSTPESSILFWSGNMAFALAISSNDPRFVSVEETSTGYVLNSLTWCGTPNHTFDYSNPCYYPSNKTYYGMQGIWNRASRAFAHGARGDVFVLLQPQSIGGDPPVYQAFRNFSIFAQIELPSMNVSLVRSISIMLLRNKTQSPNERCGSGSILDLTNRIIAKFNFTPSCIDDPQEIYARLCPEKSQVSGACLAATLVYNYENENSNQYLLWAIITTVIAGVLFILVLLLLARVGAYARKGRTPA